MEPAATDTTAATGGVTLSIREGVVSVHGEHGDAPARLSWPSGVIVLVDDQPVPGTTTQVGAGSRVRASVASVEPRCEYDVQVAPDRMQATMCVRRAGGVVRRIQDADAGRDLAVVVVDEQVPPPDLDVAAAVGAVQQAGLSFGVERPAIEEALRDEGTPRIVAVGREAVQGRSGYVQPLLDFAERATSGVPVGTALMRVVPRRDGVPGMDVTGRELSVREVRDARLRIGAGAELDASGLIVVATVDGQPVFDGDSFVEVRHELVLDEVGTGTGDIDFCGSVRVTGGVHEGRHVRAGHQLLVEGNVDRAHLSSGGRMEVHGSVMSSVLRAGGERAVAAGVIDRLVDVPGQLAEAATRARELRDAAEERGTALSHGLSIQLVIERMYRQMMDGLRSAADELAAAGDQHAEVARDLAEAHRVLSTAAVGSLAVEQLMDILDRIGRHVDAMRRAVEERAHLVVTYMQASEVEATGVVTLGGKGVFNSKVVAWGGLLADHPKAVVRGGSIVSHGPVMVAEIGSPGGASMQVQLGRESALDAELVYSGTVVTSPGQSHRFIADRSHVKVTVSAGGMDVESLAA